MSNHLEAHVGIRMATLERRLEEQHEEMKGELDALIKMNQALSKENEGLPIGTTTHSNAVSQCDICWSDRCYIVASRHPC